MLEGWLDDAREGKLLDVAVVAVRVDGIVESDWNSGTDSLRLIGALEQVKHDLLNAGKEEDE